MEPSRAALYVDFDNFFGGLMAADQSAALDVAEHPSRWVQRLTRAHSDQGGRRWLVLRCYLNPAGWLPDPRQPESRLYFSKFRPFFTRAGFEVVDCPSLTRGAKNGADIRIVVDIMSALRAETRLDEIVIASSDADFTPLLHVVRAQDRRITIIATGETAIAYEALADRYLSEEDIVDLMSSIVEDEDEDEDAEPVAQPPGPAPGTQPSANLQQGFRDAVTEAYRSAAGPINLSSLSTRLLAELGPELKQGNYLGHGSFVKAVERVKLPNVAFSGHHFWDTSRHTAPSGATTHTLPAAVSQFCEVTGLPRLDTALWPATYRLLADYAAEHEFDLSEATKMTRDAATAEGLGISRQVFTFVVRACYLQGVTLNANPRPSAAGIATALLSSTLSRATAAGLEFSETDRAELATWLHAD